MTHTHTLQYANGGADGASHSVTQVRRRGFPTPGDRDQAAREPGEIAPTGQEASAQPSGRRRGGQTATGAQGRDGIQGSRDVRLASETAVLHGT